MKQVTSHKNPLFKELKQLAFSSSARRKASKTLLDGVHITQMYLEQFGMPLVCAFTAAAREHTETGKIIQHCWDSGVECVELSETVYRELSPVEHGVGLLFVIKTPFRTIRERLETSALLLDGVQDPGNMGTMLRTAAAVGVKKIFCSADTVAVWSPKVLRAGQGAHFVLDIYENANLAQVIGLSDIPVIATNPHAAKTLYETDLDSEVAWLFGSEGRGVSEELLQKVALQVAIPHTGDIESLNVAMAAAVCLFEQQRQQKFATIRT